MSVEFYCMKGKHRVKVSNPDKVRLTDTKGMYKATCPTHKNGMTQFCSVSPSEKLQQHHKKSKSSKSSKKGGSRRKSRKSRGSKKSCK